MAQKQNELLLKDLSARLPYNPLADVAYLNGAKCKYAIVNTPLIRDLICEDLVYVKPYLRPMSSMTEEERKIHNGHRLSKWSTYSEHISETIDWLNAHHFDYRGLIPMGLAIEVTEKNNPYK